MSRKPFEALTGESFEDAYGITQHDWNGRPDIPWMEVQARSRDVANAAIAADKAHHVYLLDIGELRIEAVIQERDALREENERNKKTALEYIGMSDKMAKHIVAVEAQLAEAVGLIEEVAQVSDHSAKHANDMRTNWCVQQFDYLHGKAREFLAKVKA